MAEPQPEFPRSHNLASLPLDEQARLAIDDALTRPKARWTELEASYQRAPAEIIDEDVAGRVTTLIAQLAALQRQIDLAHEATKQPWLEAGRVVDGIANRLREIVGPAKVELEKRLAAYQRAKEQRIEAERAAERASYDEVGDPEPAWAAAPKPSRRAAAVRSDEGASAFLVDDVQVEVVDVRKVPVRYLRRPKVLAAIAAEIKPDAKKGDVIAGIVVHNNTKSRVRRG